MKVSLTLRANQVRTDQSEPLEWLAFQAKQVSQGLPANRVKRDLLVFQVNLDYQARPEKKGHKVLPDLKANRDPSVHQDYRVSLVREV